MCKDAALNANRAGLDAEENVNSYQWILASELLIVLNEATREKTLTAKVHSDSGHFENGTKRLQCTLSSSEGVSD